VVLAPSRLHLPSVTSRGSDTIKYGLHSNPYKSHFLLLPPYRYRPVLIHVAHYPETPWSTSPAVRRQRRSQQMKPPADTQSALAEIPGFHHLKSRLLSFPLQGSSRFYRVSGQLLRAVPHQTPSNWPSDGQLLNIQTSILSSFTASSPTTANSSSKVLGPFQRLKLLFFTRRDGERHE
ncbi:hypothetical protein CSPX01_02459, partial [Colletotrichum filicis]